MKNSVLAAACLCLGGVGAHGQLLISEFFANPPGGTDSPLEWVELVAASDINFALTPYSVVFTDGPGASGWVTGGSATYGFNINSGSVSRGDVVYVGGSGMAPTGAKLRVIDTLTTPGDGFGDARAGVLGNGGNSADGIAVFNTDISGVNSSLAPIDAIFFGNAGSGAGSPGYTLPVNDNYSGGALDGSSFVAPDPGSGTTSALGTYNPQTGMWDVPRIWTAGVFTDNAASLALVPVPEPSQYMLLGLGGLLGWLAMRRRK